MAIGRISGSVLKSNLTRNGTDLAFETNLLYLDVTNSRVGIGTSEPSTTLQVAGTVTATAFAGDGSNLTGINVDTNIQLVGDDSTGATLGTGETFKIAGGTNITTAVSGDTLTVTGPDLTSYLTASSTHTLTNKTFDANGTGNSITNIDSGNFLSGFFLDEDNMASNSATSVASQQSIKAYVDSQVTAQDLDFQADSGGALSIDLDSEALTFTGGTGIDTTGSGNAVTFAIDSTVTTLAGTQTLTNKTLTTPVISSISNTGTLTLPTSTDTLVGRATTDTLTNKTLTSPTIDNVTSTNFTVDASADIFLDAGGGDIILRKGGGTQFAHLTNSNDDFVVKANVQDKDLIIKGNDGGSEITALSLDMSNAGEATFNAGVTATDLKLNTTGTGDTILLTATEDSSTAAPVLTFKRNSSSPADADYLGQIKFKGENDADQEVVYAKITGKISDASDTTEDGLIEFALRKAGSNNIGARLTSTELKLINGTGLEVAGLTYPTSDGSAGQVLKTDGSGNLSFTTISTNSVSQGDSNVTVTDSGTGAITVAADGGTIITMNATTVLDASAVTNAIRLPNGTTAQRPSGAVGEIRYNSSTDTIEGYTSAGGWAQLGATSSTAENTNDTATDSETAISTTEKVINQFATGTYDSAWYLAITRDEINDEVATAKYSLVHNDTSAFVAHSHITESNASNSYITVDADVAGGNARLKATGSSVVNSVSYYRIALGDNTTAGTTGNVTTTINTDVDSAAEKIDGWALASYRGAKYYISVNNTTTGELSNTEALVVHDGSTAYITQYGNVNTGNNDLITLTAEVDSTEVILKASAQAPNCRVTAYRILLADDESASTGDNVNLIEATTVSSAATTVDSFNTSTYTGAFYVFTGYNSSEGAASISEVMVVANDEAYVTQGPSVSTKGTGQLEVTASLSGSTVTVQAASTSGASTTVNGYRVQMLRGSAGASTADTVLVSTEQTITGQKTFTAGVLTDTIQSPASNADITLDPQGTGVVRIKSNILPDVNTTYDIGSASLRFNDIYLSGNTVNLGGTKIQRTSDGDVEFKDASNNRKTVIVEQIELGTGADRVKLSKRADGGLKITDSTDSRVEILQIVGDDSSGNGLFSGETFKFAGTGGISTSVTDDVLTIDGSSISAGVDVVGDTTPQLGGDLDLNSSDITGTGNVNITGTITATTITGALMDSEVTNLAQVKAFDSSDYATAAQGTTADAALPKTGGAMTGAITTNSTFDGRDVATDGTKLDTIATSATANPNAIDNVVEDTTPQLGGQLDVNGNALGDGTLELLKFSETASAVNELTITNAATGNGPQLSATGDDTNIDLKLTTKGTGAIVATGNVVPEANGTRDLGSSSNRWANIYTSDLNLNNGIGNYTIVEGEDDLFLYNNKSGKTYKFMLAEVDPNTVPKKMEE